MSTLEKSLPKPMIELYSGKYFAACGLGGIIGEPRFFHMTAISEALGETLCKLELSKMDLLLVSLTY